YRCFALYRSLLSFPTRRSSDLFPLEPVLAPDELWVEVELRELGLDRGHRLVELRLRGGIDEDGVLVVRDGEPLVAQVVRQVVGVGVDEAEQAEQATGPFGAELDSQPPVVLWHAGTLVGGVGGEAPLRVSRWTGGPSP